MNVLNVTELYTLKWLKWRVLGYVTLNTMESVFFKWLLIDIVCLHFTVCQIFLKVNNYQNAHKTP